MKYPVLKNKNGSEFEISRNGKGRYEIVCNYGYVRSVAYCLDDTFVWNPLDYFMSGIQAYAYAKKHIEYLG